MIRSKNHLTLLSLQATKPLKMDLFLIDDLSFRIGILFYLGFRDNCVLINTFLLHFVGGDWAGHYQLFTKLLF